MGQIRDLVKTLRAGAAAHDLKTARAVVESARREGISPAEVKELKRLLDSPEFKDLFSAEVRATLQTFVTGEAPALLKSVAALVGELDVLVDAHELPDRFAAEFTMLKDQLLGRGLSPDQKAERVLAFLAAYAERFVALARGEPAPPKPQSQSTPLEGKPVPADGAPTETPPAPLDLPVEKSDGLGFLASESPSSEQARQKAQSRSPLTPEQQEKEAKRFSQLARSLGFDEVKDARSGKTGSQLAYEWIAAPSRDDVRAQVAQAEPKPSGLRSDDAPLISRHEQEQPARPAERRDAAREAPRPELERAAGRQDGFRVSPQLADAPRPVIQPPAPRDGAQKPEESPRRAAGVSDRRLGKNMLWNVLHRFRGEELEKSALEEDAWNQVAVGALLVLGLIAVGAVLLVSL